MLEVGLEESILAKNEKTYAGGAQFLKVTKKDMFSRIANRTLNLQSESDHYVATVRSNIELV
ncbi:hypothetical protein LEP1GSC074_0264 [Leptospira noguchii str. Hook]|uniref:hypothetical protein n=1 Tax=Leptospira noguchii TaxID=28182 RepID=UPI000328771B|nr:hypothetical protein [Leptospira noguchii]EMS83666.1 hypothetical protein LEP1GSC074_0264 [Leptospira noguchii str. Hook]UOG44515.1 hypothetical protein MAL01_14135 [Leptospira noguchii]